MNPVVVPGLKGLAGVAETVAREGRSRWVGKVRVTVVSNLSRNRLLDIDECMDVEASYQPSIDSALAADMQRLAIFETVNSATVVPKPLPDPPAASLPPPCFVEDASHQSEHRNVSTDNVNEHEQPLQSVNEEVHFADGSLTTSSSEDFLNDTVMPVVNDVLFDDTLFADPKYDLSYFLESPMLPADPSTLPGGIELCMDGMDLEEDFCSLITDEKDISSSVDLGRFAKADFGSEKEPPASKITAGTLEKATAPVSREKHANDSEVPAVRALFDDNQTAPHSSTRKDEDRMQQQQSDEVSARHLKRSQQYLHDHDRRRSHQMQGHRIEHTPSQLPQQLRPQTSTQSTWVQPIAPMAPKQEELLHADLDEVTDVKPHLVSRGARLAPRPAGMSACSDGFIWQMGNAYAIAVRLEAAERERKAEERRKKNRQAAARSNARKKSMMDAYKAELKQENDRIAELRRKESELRRVNLELKRRMDMDN